MVKQLDLIPRTRVKLEEIEEDRRFGQPHHGHGLEEMEEEELRLRVPKKVAEAVAADPEGATQHLKKEAERLAVPELNTAEPWVAGALGCTKWFCWEVPPCQGLYEVTEHRTGAVIERWWFHGGSVWKKSGDRFANLPSIYHHDFARQYAWRGLAEMPAEGYPIPPYARHMFEQREDMIVPPLRVMGVERPTATRRFLEE